ncbi:MAG: cytochrome c oxidase accessory protein CcoG [Rickettsiales bacterium]|nr:cytochrome c oxidase accessory protein CcoG [Rickettsiales bacterium]
MTKLFEAKKRLYPQQVKGRIRKIKSLLNVVFLSIYLLSPLIRFDRGEDIPNQAILIDLPNSKAYFFWIEIWPQEVFYLAGILIIAAITLFFVTSLFGRIWCGYACFQTVWTDIFIAIERFFQGDRNERILLDRKNSFKKFWRKFLTHFCWILVGLVTGFGFVCYFNDIFILSKDFLELKFVLVPTAWILGIAAATYIMAGFAREHVCTYMCPYARFQSAMFDENTLIITYDQKRGEPRGKHKKGESFNNRGDCIDCKQCVVVCPTGIDIRNGLQMECIACGLCVDACDEVMDKIGRPRGLIRYDTEKNLLNPSPKNKFRFFKPRTFYYGAILLIVSGLVLQGLIFRSDLEVDAMQNRNPMFVTLSDGSVRNGYTLKIINKTHQAKIFQLLVKKPAEAEIKLQSFDGLNDVDNLVVDKDSVATFTIYITLSKDFVSKNSDSQNLIVLSISDKLKLTRKDFNLSFISK